MTYTPSVSRRTVLKATAATGATAFAGLGAGAGDDDTHIEITIAQTRRMRRAAEASERNAGYALDVTETFLDAYLARLTDPLDNVDGYTIRRGPTVDLALSDGTTNDPQTGRGVADISMRLLEFLGHTQDGNPWSDHSNLVIDTPHWEPVLGVALLDDFAINSPIAKASICDYGRALLDVEPEYLTDPPERALFSDPAETDREPERDPEGALNEMLVGYEWMIVNTAVHEVLHNLGVHHHDGELIQDEGAAWATPIMGGYAMAINENRCGATWDRLQLFERPFGFTFEPAQCEIESLAVNADAPGGGTAVDDPKELIHVDLLHDDLADALGH